MTNRVNCFNLFLEHVQEERRKNGWVSDEIVEDFMARAPLLSVDAIAAFLDSLQEDQASQVEEALLGSDDDDLDSINNLPFGSFPENAVDGYLDRIEERLNVVEANQRVINESILETEAMLDEFKVYLDEMKKDVDEMKKDVDEKKKELDDFVKSMEKYHRTKIDRIREDLSILDATAVIQHWDIERLKRLRQSLQHHEASLMNWIRPVP